MKKSIMGMCVILIIVLAGAGGYYKSDIDKTNNYRNQVDELLVQMTLSINIDYEKVKGTNIGENNSSISDFKNTQEKIKSLPDAPKNCKRQYDAMMTMNNLYTDINKQIVAKQ